MAGPNADLIRSAMGQDTARPGGMEALGPAIQVAIMDAGKGGCTCSSCQALLQVQEVLRQQVRGAPAPGSG